MTHNIKKRNEKYKIYIRIIVITLCKSTFLLILLISRVLYASHAHPYSVQPN